MPVLFFFLSGNYGRYDTNYALRSGSFKELIENLRPDCILGIHPSYRSNRDENLLHSEFAFYSGLLGKRPELSRQHFLLLSFPETYRRLIKQGITCDYSMGYAGHTGFRAGTCRPFRFYDLKEELETGLMLHPFQVMDVTLQQYLRLNPPDVGSDFGNDFSWVSLIDLAIDGIQKADLLQAKIARCAKQLCFANPS